MAFEQSAVRHFSDGSFALRCAFCEGNGLEPDTSFSYADIQTEACQVCRGRGINRFAVSSEYLFNCRYCDGSGRGWDDQGHFIGNPCPICGGRGVVMIEEADPAAYEHVWPLMHPRIAAVAKERFESGHLADAVEAALKEVNSVVKAIVREKTGEELDGAKAMNRALSPSSPLIPMGDLTTRSGQDMQTGYVQLMAGAMTGIRNPKAHENLLIDAPRAVHHLFVASLMMSKIDEGLTMLNAPPSHPVGESSPGRDELHAPRLRGREPRATDAP